MSLYSSVEFGVGCDELLKNSWRLDEYRSGFMTKPMVLSRMFGGDVNRHVFGARQGSTRSSDSTEEFARVRSVSGTKSLGSGA